MNTSSPANDPALFLMCWKQRNNASNVKQDPKLAGGLQEQSCLC